MTVATYEMGDALSMVAIWEEVTGLPVYEKLQLPSEDSGMSPVMLLLVGGFKDGSHWTRTPAAHFYECCPIKSFTGQSSLPKTLFMTKQGQT